MEFGRLGHQGSAPIFRFCKVVCSSAFRRLDVQPPKGGTTNNTLPLSCANSSAGAAQRLQAFAGLVALAGVGLVRVDLLVQFDGLPTIEHLPVVESGGAHAGIQVRVRVPLEGTLEVGRSTAVLLVRLVLVDVAELISRISDLITLRILGDQLLKEQFSAALVIDEFDARALALELHGADEQLVGLGNVDAGLQGLGGNMEPDDGRLLGNAVE